MTPGSDNREPPAEYVLLGRLGRVFGLEGAMRFRPLGTAEAAAIHSVEEVFVAGLGSARVTRVHRHGDELLVTLDRVRTREPARELANAAVWASSEKLPVTDEDEAYRDALEGRPVLHAGERLGTIAEVTGVDGAEIITVDRADGGRLLLPMRAPYVHIGAEAVTVIDPPLGLLEPGDVR